MRRSHLYQSIVNFLIQFGRTIRQLTFDVLEKLLHLALHFFKPLPHVEDYLDAGEIHAKISGEIQDKLETLEIFLSL